MAHRYQAHPKVAGTYRASPPDSLGVTACASRLPQVSIRHLRATRVFGCRVVSGSTCTRSSTSTHRYMPGWLLAKAESAELAKKLLGDTIAKQGEARNRLSVQADRGTLMASKPVTALLVDFGVANPIRDRTARTTAPTPKTGSRR